MFTVNCLFWNLLFFYASAHNLDSYLPSYYQEQDFSVLYTFNPWVQALIVSKHNLLRRIMPATNMLQMHWSPEAAYKAQSWSNQCYYMHDHSSNRRTAQYTCGQNIASTSPFPVSWDKIIQTWYEEINDFRYGDQPLGIVGHYTQIVWATSWQVGCGYTNCGTFHYYVCDYCPAGNVIPYKSFPFKWGYNCAECMGYCEDGLCLSVGMDTKSYYYHNLPYFINNVYPRMLSSRQGRSLLESTNTTGSEEFDKQLKIIFNNFIKSNNDTTFEAFRRKPTINQPQYQNMRTNQRIQLSIL